MFDQCMYVSKSSSVFVIVDIYFHCWLANSARNGLFYLICEAFWHFQTELGIGQN